MPMRLLMCSWATVVPVVPVFIHAGLRLLAASRSRRMVAVAGGNGARPHGLGAV